MAKTSKSLNHQSLITKFIAAAIITLIIGSIIHMECSKCRLQAELIVTYPSHIDTLKIVASFYGFGPHKHQVWYDDDSDIFTAATYHQFQLLNGDTFTIPLSSKISYRIINTIKIQK